MEVKDIERLQKELDTHTKDIWGLEQEKQKKKFDILYLETRIRKLKEANAVPKQIWRLENELAETIRDRNTIADRLRAGQIEERRMKQALAGLKQEYLKERLKQEYLKERKESLKALERKRPRMGALGWKRPGTRALEWKKPRMRAREWKKPRKGRKR